MFRQASRTFAQMRNIGAANERSQVFNVKCSLASCFGFHEARLSEAGFREAVARICITSVSTLDLAGKMMSRLHVT